jgi:hypothetical protein
MRRQPDWDSDDWALARAFAGDEPDPLTLPAPRVESDELHESGEEPGYDEDDETDDDTEWASSPDFALEYERRWWARELGHDR